MQIIENAPLISLNSFKIAATAKYLVRLENASEIDKVRDEKCFDDLPFLFLGEGSNIIFRNDFNGVIIQPQLTEFEQLGTDNGFVLFRIGAGHNWHQLVQKTIQLGYAGLENLSLIPGTVGAAPIQNIGAYGVELKSCFHQLEAYDLVTGKNLSFDLDAAQLGYRDSYFKRHPDRFLIHHVTLKLPMEPTWHLDYSGLKEALVNTEINAKNISDAVSKLRREKLPDPVIQGNAGSFFKNPVINQHQAVEIKAQYPNIPLYSQDKQRTKLSAAWLIDQCGWKGFREGNVGVSAQHALVLVNHGNATGEAVWQLCQQIKDSVGQAFGIQLEAEPRIID